MSRFYWKLGLWTRAYCMITADGAPIKRLKIDIQKQENPTK
ncbi:hypothetical protein LG003_18395 [Photorhabdus kleinii]|nr:hypothetical protein [Photorhabdus kleinii]RAX01341.1 hypothetical protein CKY05_06160 [Photorhabdus sp. S10-54]RAX02266.1 hypothetical protein CKY03_04665 [Photorhabdus sp. S9-53]RAX04989.1 hypothetical protein CKY04_07415 [Photorhabdus sp. S8-52]